MTPKLPTVSALRNAILSANARRDSGVRLSLKILVRIRIPRAAPRRGHSLHPLIAVSYPAEQAAWGAASVRQTSPHY
jgi:hypothetical protein